MSQMNHPMPEERLAEIEQIHCAGSDEDPDHDTRAHCHRGELIEEVRRLRAQGLEAVFVVNQNFAPGFDPDKVYAAFKESAEQYAKEVLKRDLRPLYDASAQEPTTVVGLPVFCDFCDCADCQGGREGLTHAATADGRWICDVCYTYDLCTGANKQVPRAPHPCADKNCAHRPRLISAFVPKLFPVDQEITPGVWATRWHAMKKEPTPAPLDDEERAELAALRLYDQSCAGGDRPMSPAAGKLKRLMELEAREKVKG